MPPRKRQSPKITPPVILPGESHESAISNALAAGQHELAQASKGASRLSFVEYVNEFPLAPNYMWGRHTHGIAAELQACCDAIEAGRSYYCIISIPPRHGKSDFCSRRFPPFILTRNPDIEVMLGTYAANLSEDLAHEARRCFEWSAPKWGLRLSDDRNQIGAWRIQDHRGGMFSVGLGGSLAGRGANVLIIDDYCRNRQEAESEVIRDTTWDAFRNDCMTRLAPAHAVIILATRWHEDDLVGRIKIEMAKNADFPRFKFVNYPAWDEKQGWLFPERFSDAWYKQQRAAVGAYAWQSLYLGDPKPRAGALLRADLIDVVEKLPDGLKFSRGWDLASTEKERVKDDPDYTAGVKTAFDGKDLWVADVKRGRWAALERDNIIMQTALADGPGCPVYIEVVAGYRDTYTRMRSLLAGRANVRPVIPKGDKMQRMSIFEPLMEAKRVHVLKGDWNADFIAELLGFPKAKHDDQCDGLQVSSFQALTSKNRMGLSL